MQPNQGKGTANQKTQGQGKAPTLKQKGYHWSGRASGDLYIYILEYTDTSDTTLVTRVGTYWGEMRLAFLKTRVKTRVGVVGLTDGSDLREKVHPVICTEKALYEEHSPENGVWHMVEMGY